MAGEGGLRNKSRNRVINFQMQMNNKIPLNKLNLSDISIVLFVMVLLFSLGALGNLSFYTITSKQRVNSKLIQAGIFHEPINIRVEEVIITSDKNVCSRAEHCL